VDIAAIISEQGGGFLALNPAQREGAIAAAKAEGGKLEYKADGSAEYTAPDGSKVTQKPDGTWLWDDESGNDAQAQIGGDWPDNEFTKQIPKPDIAIAATATEGGEFIVTFSGATEDTVKAYIEKVKAAGYNGELFEGSGMVSFEGANAAGYKVNIVYSAMASAMTISKS
jgi:hypothetical protein